VSYFLTLAGLSKYSPKLIVLKQSYQVQANFFFECRASRTTVSLESTFQNCTRYSGLHVVLTLFVFFSLSWPSLWSSGHSSWLQILRSRFDSLRYQIFWEVVGLERGLLGLANTIEGLLERKSSGCGLENREYSRRDTSRWPRDILYPQKLTLTSPTSSVGIVR
jgi:hypothetical protein